MSFLALQFTVNVLENNVLHPRFDSDLYPSTHDQNKCPSKTILRSNWVSRRHSPNSCLFCFSIPSDVTSFIASSWRSCLAPKSHLWWLLLFLSHHNSAISNIYTSYHTDIRDARTLTCSFLFFYKLKVLNRPASLVWWSFGGIEIHTGSQYK